MAQQVIITVVCDLHDTEAEGETVRLSLDGRDFEIDVCPEHRNALDAALAPFLSAARPLSRSQAAKNRRSKKR